MSSLAGWSKLALIGLFAIPLAALSCAHALSSASLRNSPALALAAFPANGLAQEKLAYATLTEGIAKSSSKAGRARGGKRVDDGKAAFGPGASSADLKPFALPAAESARAALVSEPLSPRALAMLALAAPDADQHNAIITRAARLSRRDPVLQALRLEQQGETGDFIGAIATIDEILRVHPEQQAQFFPVLGRTLGVKAAVPGLARLLARPLVWRDAFLDFAVTQPDLLDNLAALRERMATSNTTFDRNLIAALADSGRLAAAARIYRMVGGAGLTSAGSVSLPWTSDYPPFDWRFADQSGFRAQISDMSSRLTIDVAPGNGGVIAGRLLPNPGRPMTLRIAHDVEPVAQIGDMQLAIACASESEPFFEGPFSSGESVFVVPSTPDCPHILVSIRARSWTGGRNLAGTLAPLRIVADRE